jgi:hypothetical protein
MKSKIIENKIMDKKVTENKIVESKLAKSRLKISKNYSSALPTLILGLLFSTITLMIIFLFQPYQIANLGVSNLFLPLLIPFFMAIFLIASYLLLNSRLGWLIACSITAITWTLLIAPNLLLLVILGFAVWYFLLIVFSKKYL